MIITSELFKAFIQCPTKGFLHAQGTLPTGNIYADWIRREAESYRSAHCARLAVRYAAFGSRATPLGLGPESGDWRLAVDVCAQSQNLESRIHAVERRPSPQKGKPHQFVPIRFIPANRPSNLDKLMIVFDALALSEMTAQPVAFGRIIHGSDATSVRIKIAAMADKARRMIDAIKKTLEATSAPDLVLNRHCTECEFHARCRQKAVEADDLSLFSGMSAQERERHRGKGIFTVNQLSYTFRPRRQAKREKPLTNLHYFSLRALAIRENTVYVHGNPQLPDVKTSVYLDIEGLSTSGPYYLAGVLIVSKDTEEFLSFWADHLPDAASTFTQLVELISQLPDFRVFHYGAYDTAALKLMRPKLPERLWPKVDMLLQRAVNVLSVIHHHVYFPTYTNGLKDLGRFLGYQRETEIQSGLQSIIWRRMWESDANPETKEVLLRYNRDDCLALRRLCDFIRSLEVPNASSDVGVPKTARVDAIPPEDQFRISFGAKKFALEDLQQVTKCAYFDYQREKVLFRTHPHLMPPAKSSSRIDPKRLRPNRTVMLASRCCPNCGSKRVEQRKLVNYFLIDLRFMRRGVKRFITKFSSWRCLCLKCSIPFSSGDPPGNPIKFGRTLKVWCTYWSVVRGLQLDRVRRSLNDLFGISIQTAYLCRFRRSLSLEYSDLYNELRQHILGSPVLFIDETPVRLSNRKKAYVWVLATLDAVFFLYRPNREGEFLTELLRPFQGVLVSDFYAAYDSLGCRQQKCLVHFVRDIDDDLLKNPLDVELKTIAQGFGTLLRTIIESVDRFGLKKRHLQKHKKAVNRFLASVQSRKLTSELATSYKQRLQKSGDKMFTFLEHDGVPWNNNYAEHAIKRFAKYRRVFDGLVTEDSLTEALILGSILNTCEFNNVNALKFLLSGEKSLDALVKSAKPRGKLRGAGNTGSQSEEVRPYRSESHRRSQASVARVSCMDPDWKDRCRDHSQGASGY